MGIGWRANETPHLWRGRVAEMAENKRQTLLSEAKNATSDWRTELQLSIISDEDKARPSDWMIYIKAVDVLQVKDEETFDKIEWPLKPEE